MIRLARGDDLEALGRLGALLMRTHYAFDPRRFLAPGAEPESGYAWFLETQLREPDAAIFVAEQDGRVVGYIYAGLEPLSWKELRGPAGFIHDIVVEDQARGSGVGRELIGAAMQWLRQRGAPRVMLWTAAQNERAQRLFDAAGFRKTMIEMTLELERTSQAASAP